MSQLLQVLEHYGIEMRGERALVKCPLDHEDHPSCSVDLDKGLWNCHSCGQGGDAITLIERREGLGYTAALGRLTAITGEGNGAVRAGGKRRPGVPAGKGYQPRFRRAVPAGVRHQP